MKNKQRNLLISAGTKEYIMFFALAGVFILGACVHPKFLSVENLTNLMRQSAALGVLCLGVTVATIGGKRDISVGSIISCAACASITLQDIFSPWVSLLVLVLGVAAIGCINGGIIALTNGMTGDSFIITYGMCAVLRAFASFVSGGKDLILPVESNTVSAIYGYIGSGMLFGKVPCSFLIFIVFALLTHLFLTKTITGRQIFYFGSNPRCAKLSGIPVVKVQFIMYLVTAFAAAFAALLLTGRTYRANATMGINLEMDALAAITIGGISLYGGKGNILQTVLGVLIFTTLSNVLGMWGLDTRVQMMATGAMIVLAVCLENAKTKNNNAAKGAKPNGKTV